MQNDAVMIILIQLTNYRTGQKFTFRCKWS